MPPLWTLGALLELEFPPELREEPALELPDC
jgi:hypothetical protein